METHKLHLQQCLLWNVVNVCFTAITLVIELPSRYQSRPLNDHPRSDSRELAEAVLINHISFKPLAMLDTQAFTCIGYFCAYAISSKTSPAGSLKVSAVTRARSISKPLILQR